jgi:hypothetical protein
MLNTTERQVDDLPRADDPFVMGTTWAEFKCENIPRNSAQVKIDFKKEDQLWYYLGKTSTEAKAQFTEDPANPRNNLKGHFLDTIPKPVPVVPRQSYAASYPSSLTQNVLNASRPLNRPPQPTAFIPNSSKPEKPYQYKPRTAGGEAYRVDPQAFRQQHSFVQRSTQGSSPAPPPSSTPYGLKFNTDPKFQAAPRPANSYLNHSTSQATPMGPLAPPASYRPPQPLPAPPPRATSSGNPHNIFGVKNMSKLSPFAKYAYLQKEHNRSPLEYKSPYRPGGGFMNGYQGTKEQIEAAYRKQIFGSGVERKPESPVLPQEMPYGPSSGLASLPASDPMQGSVAASTPSSTYTPRPTSSLSTPSPAAGYGSTTWQKKDGSNLHPAIRPEYTVFHNQYQPSQRSSVPQHQSPTMQPPSTYGGQTPQPQSLYQMNQPQVSFEQRSSSVQASNSPGHSSNSLHSPHSQSQVNQSNLYRCSPQQEDQSLSNGVRQFANTPHFSSQQQYPTASAQQQYAPSHTIAPHQAGPSTFAPQYHQTVNVQHGIGVPPVPQQQFMPTPPKTPAMAQPSTTYPQTQTPHMNLQEGKMMYPHQQNVQNWNAEPPSLSQHAARARDFPDVPADSTSIIEKVMMNLRKASTAQLVPAKHC